MLRCYIRNEDAGVEPRFRGNITDAPRIPEVKEAAPAAAGGTRPLKYVHRTDLISPERLHELTRRNNVRAWLQVLSHAGAILATGWLLHRFWGTVWAAPLFIVHGVLINYLYAAQHELEHSTAFSNRRINELLSRITGFIVLFPRDYDRAYHFEHHRHTNVPDRDPEIMGTNPHREHASIGGFFWRLSAIPYWYGRIVTILRVAGGNLAHERYMNDREQRRVIREARSSLALYFALIALSWWAGSWWMLSLWLAPMLLTKPLHHIQNIVEHTGRPLVPDVLSSTRTIHVHPLLRWLAWNMQYHCAHHLFPAVPFYNLPALQRELEPVLHDDTQVYGYLRAARAVIRDSRSGDIQKYGTFMAS